jgi:hypothetical protein
MEKIINQLSSELRVLRSSKLRLFSSRKFFEKNRSTTSDRKFFEISIEKITKIICYASNKIGLKEVIAHLGDHFFGIH